MVYHLYNNTFRDFWLFCNHKTFLFTPVPEWLPLHRDVFYQLPYTSRETSFTDLPLSTWTVNMDVSSYRVAYMHIYGYESCSTIRSVDHWCTPVTCVSKRVLLGQRVVGDSPHSDTSLSLSVVAFVMVGSLTFHLTVPTDTFWNKRHTEGEFPESDKFRIPFRESDWVKVLLRRSVYPNSSTGL